jgi:hypothetical protein
MKKSRNPRRASINFNDATAFQLLTEMWDDCKAIIPEDFHNYVHGRLCRRDYTFVVETFPSLGLSLMQQDGEGGILLPNGRMFGMGANPKRTAEVVYAVSHFLKKYAFDESPVYTEDYRQRAALRSMRKAEKWCYIINRRCQSPKLEPLLLSEAKRTLCWAMGSVPDGKVISDRGYFGPGVNVGVNGSQTDGQWKFSLPLTITSLLQSQFSTATQWLSAVFLQFGYRSYLNGVNYAPSPDICLALQEAQERFSARGVMDVYYRRLRKVYGNKVAYVPKDSKTLRCIACEPMVNSYYQNGLGSIMVDRLAKKSASLDLRSQERNRVFARIGSNTGSFATIDLSSASDTISLGVARLLLPKEWYSLFKFLRSPRFLDRGKWVKANKLSSMGNGYTFPLESVLFYSITKAAIVCELVTRGYTLSDARRATSAHGPRQAGIYEPSVYGDDIIVRSDMYDAVSKAIAAFGFWINGAKSYAQGPFRESCGHDYHHGDYVRPIFLKKKISNGMQIITLINQLSHPEGLGWLTERFGVVFSGLMSRIAALSRQLSADLPYGPFYGRVEDLFICAPLEMLHSRDHLLWDELGQRWVYYPIVVETLREKNVSEFGYGMKILHKNEETLHPEFSNTLQALVRRGKVRLHYPKKDPTAKGLTSLPSAYLGEVPENVDRWLAIVVQYLRYYPLLKGW